MDAEEKVMAAVAGLFFAVVLSIPVGITWHSLAETSAIENMVTNGADPIAAACSMGSIAACRTSERIQAYGLR